MLGEGRDRKLGGKFIGRILLSMRGRGFMYEGEELGMRNIKWGWIKMYNDIWCIGEYELGVKDKLRGKEGMKGVWK